jgi:hypothetical protein
MSAIRTFRGHNIKPLSFYESLLKQHGFSIQKVDYLGDGAIFSPGSRTRIRMKNEEKNEGINSPFFFRSGRGRRFPSGPFDVEYDYIRTATYLEFLSTISGKKEASGSMPILCGKDRAGAPALAGDGGTR